jgi:brefeldin A-inhibited guanine nucleotide-exchange protein
MTTTCNHALYAIVDVFTQYFDTMSLILIEDLYTHLKWCVKQDNEQLARSGTNCLETFIISNGVKFNEEIWKKTCSCLFEIFKFTIPYGIMTWRPDQDTNIFANLDSMPAVEEFVLIPNKSSPESLRLNSSSRRQGRLDSTSSVTSLGDLDGSRSSKIPRSRVPANIEHRAFHDLLIKCIVQLELIQTIDNIVFYPTTSKKEDANYIAAAQVVFFIFIFFLFWFHLLPTLFEFIKTKNE